MHQPNSLRAWFNIAHLKRGSPNGRTDVLLAQTPFIMPARRSLYTTKKCHWKWLEPSIKLKRQVLADYGNNTLGKIGRRYSSHVRSRMISATCTAFFFFFRRRRPLNETTKADFYFHKLRPEMYKPLVLLFSSHFLIVCSKTLSKPNFGQNWEFQPRASQFEFLWLKSVVLCTPQGHKDVSSALRIMAALL